MIVTCRWSWSAEAGTIEVMGPSMVRATGSAFDSPVATSTLDHIGLRAASVEDFFEIRRRLIGLGATDGFVTDFGPVLSLFFVDPDGLECEVCVPNPDAASTRKPPGTPSSRFDLE